MLGGMFQKLIIREKISRIKENQFEEDISMENRVVMQKAKAKYTKYLHIESCFL